MAFDKTEMLVSILERNIEHRFKENNPAHEYTLYDLFLDKRWKY